MASNNKIDDWLPPGWKVHTKYYDARKLKCYVHLETRQKFYTKPAVLQFINDRSVSNDSSHASKELDVMNPVEQQMQLVEANPSPEWLPTGWAMEVKNRLSGAKKGTMYRVYCDPSSGCKFYSKPEVLRYLKSGAGSSELKEGERSCPPSGYGNRSVDRLEAQKTNLESSDRQIPSETDNPKVISSGQEKCYVHLETRQKFYTKPAVLRFINDEGVSNDISHASKELDKMNPVEQQMQLVEANPSPEWLPTGWTMEVKTQLSGAKKGTRCKVYCDPSSGSKFYSKPEVLRYLKSGKGLSGLKEGESSCLPSGYGNVLVEKIVDGDSKSGCNKEARNKACGNPVVRMDLPISVGKKTTTKLQTRKQLFAGEEVLQGNASLVAEGKSIKESGVRRSNRSSLRVISASAGESGLKQLFSSLEPNKITQDADEDEKSTIPIEIESPTSSSRAIVMVDYTASVAMQGCSNRKCQTKSFKESGVRRITRSSLRVGSASVGEASLKQSTFSLESDKITQEILPSKHIIEKCRAPDEAVSMTNISNKIQDADKEKKNTISKGNELPASPSRPTVMVEDPESVTMESCSIGKSQTSKRKREERKLPSQPSRSSKRLAGVGAQVVFHRIPVEHSLRASNRKSMGTKSVSSLVSLRNDLQEKPGLPNADAPKALTCQEAEHHTLDIVTHSVLATQEKHGENSNSSMQDDRDVVDLQEQTRPGNLTDEVLPKCIGQSLKDPRVTLPDSLMQDDPPLISGNLTDEVLPESIGQSSKDPRVAVPDSLIQDDPPGFSRNLTDSVISNNIAQSSKDPRTTVPDNLMQGVPYRLMQDDPHVVDLLSQPPPGFSGCLADQVSKSMAQSKDPTHSVLVSEIHPIAQGQSNETLGSKVEKPAADLPVIEEQAGSITKTAYQLLDRKAGKPAAGFPVNGEQWGSITEVVDALRDSKVEKSAAGSPVTREQPGSVTKAVDALRDSKVEKPAPSFSMTEEQPGSIPKVAEASMSDFNFPAPLWSDPCLEFAYKTLTGAIPLDDSIPKATDASLNSKVEKPAADFPVTEEQPSSIPKVAEPSMSDFDFPAPLWSDPCLEFAYKTLTGAIPLDDSLAVDDYVQHQLRTSQSNDYQSFPDIDVPSFFQNDE